MHDQINNTFSDVRFVLSEIHKSFDEIQTNYHLVGSAKNFVDKKSSLKPHDLDIVVPVKIYNEYPLNILSEISLHQEKLVRIFKQSSLSSCDLPVQIHASPTSRVNSRWIQMRMTPPANHRGYILGAFFDSLFAETGIYFGYTGVTQKNHGKTQLITLNPNFSKDVLTYLNKDASDVIDWKTDAIENMWMSSISLVKKFDGNIERFHKSILKRISVYEKTDDNYERTLDSVRQLR